MRVVVTGGSGGAGQWVIPELLAAGYTVTCGMHHGMHLALCSVCHPRSLHSPPLPAAAPLISIAWRLTCL